ncbi:sigma-70 family RNA polymerase sigma factor [Actinomadura adrarensis]|uniref:Sigma-70 family RNA polymerase sigma factor n=1 Tax=Actinomadura adrarensis TaxID=1819600 RepID=A0ABW3CNQ6_9ACTN
MRSGQPPHRIDQPGTGLPRVARGDEENQILWALARLPDGDARKTRLRAKLAERYQGLAATLARRYSHRGEPLEDLLQTANVGLVKAINGFEPQRGFAFTSYAVPVILGELKRHFRDCGWAMRVPRRTQLLKLRVHHAVEELAQQLGERPSPRQLAEHLDLGETEVLEGMEGEAVYSTLSLEAFSEGDHPRQFEDGEEDLRIELLVDRASVWPLLDQLEITERTVLLRRFYGNQTQGQIARALGISQPHVSRLESKACAWIRERLAEA